MNRISWLIALAALSGGCATTPPAEPSPAAEQTVAMPRWDAFHGKVVRVNEADGYVVLECTHLPSAGEEITLFRDSTRSIRSRVRVGAAFSGRWVVADVIDGRPAPGDWFIGHDQGP